MNNSKQQKIKTVAKELFWKHGFKRVSVEEICVKANISKMTFYRLYSNKIELAKEVYNDVVTQGYLDFKEIINGKQTPEKKIHQMILMKIEGTNNISQEFLMDFYLNNDCGLKEFVESKTNELWQYVLQDFKNAQEMGIFRKDFKPEFLFLMIQKIIDIYNDKNALKMFENPQDLILEMTNLLIYGITPRNLKQ